jgi:hypothetical protein
MCDLPPVKFHVSKFSVRVLTAIKEKAEYRFRLIAMLLFYITRKGPCFLDVNYRIKVYNVTFSEADVPTSVVQTNAILTLFTV